MLLLIRKIRIVWKVLKETDGKVCCFALCEYLRKLSLKNEMHQKGPRSKKYYRE